MIVGGKIACCCGKKAAEGECQGRDGPPCTCSGPKECISAALGTLSEPTLSSLCRSGRGGSPPRAVPEPASAGTDGVNAVRSADEEEVVEDTPAD